jgi:hypothetical protein
LDGFVPERLAFHKNGSFWIDQFEEEWQGWNERGGEDSLKPT